MRRRERSSLRSSWVTLAGSVASSPAAHKRLPADSAGATEEKLRLNQRPLRNRIAIATTGLALLLGMGGLAGTEEVRVHIFGYYSFVGEAPQPFQAIKWVELWPDPRSGHAGAVKGSIRLNEPPLRGRYANVELTSVRFVGPELSFQSRERKGVRYRFSGRFLKLGDFTEIASPGEVVLEGRVSEVRKGNVVAEADVRFQYYTGD